ncbi:hypothetical protein TREMEDRAFT_30040 [Tremella mesenterica DSM 1558]|uniref:uncharacterized protein n=1 Tax=Tremella mesenterica (strain ATCC 24925 / CBS 8224 / DSM 1558 / NBRC 9311 / NRRL Y-6157 / RJB 2259-6 / UBC 559-6) TaxID=578456 RepID=UPI0003F48CC1|nr:uncharacterized protein TREMEDRAFT_30040 [Tremella mesenterica DSM 1558]EIW70197.1 hypothetical protein TREMEDRAFT_30040 [Tremella mesenterica DSM 1558]
MAKSLRAKTKMAGRRKKRNDSHYAVVEAARTARVSEKLLGKSQNSEEEVPAAEEEITADSTDERMAEEPKKISTAGPRMSRRESWRLSKGMSARPKNQGGQNKAGYKHAAKGAGKPGRRR